MTLTDWIMAAAVVVQAVYAAATFHRDRPKEMEPEQKQRPIRPILIVAALMLTTWAAVGFNYYDRHYRTAPVAVTMQGWGISPIPGSLYPSFTAQVDTQPLVSNAKDYKLLLIARNNWANVDRLTDTAIEKSGLYSIDGSGLTMQFIGKGVIRWGLNSVNYGQLYVAMIPSDVSADQITRLADVEKVGGKIIASGSQAVAMGGPPIGANPSPQSPPSTPPKTPQ
jgi:hypothetical protein